MSRQPQDGNSKQPQEDDHDLHEPIDWMVYSHKQLYDMVHTGVNLATATNAAANWKAIAEAVATVRNNLHKAVEDSTDGWESESARLARDGLFKVTDWVDDTAKHALKVSECITSETNNVEAARAAMPPPPEAPAPPVPTPTPLPPAGRMIERPTFVDRQAATFGVETDHTMATRLAAQDVNQFTGLATVAQSPVEQLAAADASHRRAADVMAAFQRNSAAVDQTVPAQFTPPVNPVNPVLTDTGTRTPTPTPTPDGGGAGGGGPVATPAPGSTNRATTNTSGRGGSSGRGGYGGGGGMGGSRTFMPPAANGVTGGGGGGGGGSASGGSAGVLDNSRPGAAAAAASGAIGNTTKAFQNPLAMGGAAPIAGAPAAAGAREEEREHRHASYLEEDDNIFGLDRKAAPPVIGQ